MSKTKLFSFIAVIINYIPVLFSLFFYNTGYRLFPVLIILQSALIIANFAFSDSLKQHRFLSINLLISTIIANILITMLYYNNISSDHGTLLVGNYAIAIGSVSVALISLIAMSIKYIIIKKAKQ